MRARDGADHQTRLLARFNTRHYDGIGSHIRVSAQGSSVMVSQTHHRKNICNRESRYALHKVAFRKIAGLSIEDEKIVTTASNQLRQPRIRPRLKQTYQCLVVRETLTKPAVLGPRMA